MPKEVAPEYVRPATAEALFGISQKTLEWLRPRGEGPPWIKAGRAVLYPVAEFREWLESQRVPKGGHC